jgi:hypothetical protein
VAVRAGVEGEIWLVGGEGGVFGIIKGVVGGREDEIVPCGGVFDCEGFGRV